jgi:hypothetical protein
VQIIIITTLAALISVSLISVIPIVAHALVDWSLTVNLKNVPFGPDQIYVQVRGPFGNNYYHWIQNGVNPSVTFILSGNEFPEGYFYQVCVGTGVLAAVTPSCSQFTQFMHTIGDESVNFTWPGQSITTPSLSPPFIH